MVYLPEKRNRILILSPHTDDAELGAGGHICKSIKNGADILWVAFSTAKESLPENYTPDTLEKEFINVVNDLGISNYLIYDFPVRNFNKYRQKILDILIELKNTFSPNIIITPSLDDYHQDHLVISHETVRAFKSDCSILGYILPWNVINHKHQCFSVLSEDEINKKIKILNNYQSQIAKNKKYFQEDFIKAMAITCGVHVNEKYAEVFEVIRWRI